MKTKRILSLAAAIALTGFAASSQAGVSFGFSVGPPIGYAPYYAPRVYCPPPVRYYRPPLRFYYSPPVRYYHVPRYHPYYNHHGYRGGYGYHHNYRGHNWGHSGGRAYWHNNGQHRGHR